MNAVCRMFCGCCSGDGEPASNFDSVVALSTHPRCRSGALVATAVDATGQGQVLAEQSVLQDKAYWEVTIERVEGLSLGVASGDHTLGSALGDNRTTWVLHASTLKPGLRAGDVIGVSLDQSDFPVSLKFFRNGVQCADLRGPSAEPTAILQLSGADDRVRVNFGGLPFAHPPPHGFEGIIRSRSIL